MKVIIVGGGIGGAAAALSLLHEGIEVELYERTGEISEIGAGLQIAANASRILRRLGLGEALERVGVPARRVSMCDLRTDRELHVTPLGKAGAARYGDAFYQVHRPDLLAMLANALPRGVVHLNERATGYRQDGSGVTVEFESGHTARGDVLIGADGIHSTVRRQLLGEQALEFARLVAWRSLIPAERVAHLGLEPDCHVWWGPDRSAVVYWVRAMELLNFVGIVPSEEARSESWTARGEVAALRRSYAGCTPRLQQIVERIDEPFVTGYYYRYPLTRWTGGRVTLLGDSAHPMHPFLAQGACQSIEDAAVLAGVLARRGGTDPAGALQEYQEHRLGRTARVQTVARTHERMWHMRDLAEMARRNRQLRSTMEIDPPAETIWGWIFRYDAFAASRQPPVAPESCMQRPESRRAFRMWANMLTPADLDRGHHGTRDAYDRFLRENFPAPDDARLEHGDAGGVPCLRVRAAGSAASPVLLHLHGGGYVTGSAAASAGFAARLSAACGGVCVAVDYRRAPEHPYPAAIEDAVAAYRSLLEQGIDPASIALTGESAGGGLALAATLRLRDLGLPLPAATVAICPMADLAVTGASVDRAEGRDPVCTRAFLTQMAAAYLQTHDPREPYASPVYARWHGLPPLLVQAAENEALLSDAERVVAAARRDGTAAELQTWPDSVHVFPIFDFLPEAREAVANVGRFVRARVAERQRDLPSGPVQ